MGNISQKVKTTLVSICNLFIGYWTVPFAVIGFLVATNSSKGWGVQNEDGESLIPFGIVILLVLAAILIVNITRLILNIIRHKKGGMSANIQIKYIKLISYFAGILIFAVRSVIFELLK